MPMFRHLAGLSLVTATLLVGHPVRAHGLFPGPSDPEFLVEQLATDLARAQDDASAAGLSETLIAVAPSVISFKFLWQKPTVSACFWNGDKATQDAVIDADNIWDGFANLHIEYRDQNNNNRICTNENSADIRIALKNNQASDGSPLDYDPATRPATGFWSVVGTQANLVSSNTGNRYKVIVNLPDIGTYKQLNDMQNFNFLVRHELGHARGLLHEHQRAECMNWFDIPAIAKDTGWTEYYARQAVGSFDQINGYRTFYRPKLVGGYDINSIMQYNFAANWYKQIPCQTNPCQRTYIVESPSSGDKATLIAEYGAVPPAVVASSQQGAILVSTVDTIIANERSRLAALKSPPAPGIPVVAAAPINTSGAEAALDRFEKAIRDVLR
jgi:hypothetical protein